MNRAGPLQVIAALLPFVSVRGLPLTTREEPARELSKELTDLLLRFTPGLREVAAGDHVAALIEHVERGCGTGARLVHFLAWASTELLDLRCGRPVIRSLWPAELLRLLRLVDLDVLAAVHVAWRGLDVSRFCSSPTLLDHGTLAVGADTVGASEETHVHLGGAMAPIHAFLLYANGRAPVGRVGLRRGRPAPLESAWDDDLLDIRAPLAEAIGARAAMVSEAIGERWDRCPIESGARESFLDVALELHEVIGELKDREWLVEDRGPRLFRDYALALLAPQEEHPVAGERALLVWGFRGALDVRKDDGAFRRTFLRYVVCRNLVHRFFSHGDGSGGLQRFVSTFESTRLRSGRRAADGRLEAYRAYHATRDMIEQGTLGADWRISAEETLGATRARLRDWERGVKLARKNQKKRFSSSFIVHTLRVRAFAAHAPSFIQTAPLAQWAKTAVGLLQHARRDARVVRALLSSPGPSVEGFDVAAEEVLLPPAAYKSIFDGLRRAADTAGVELCFTVHAGEDFRGLVGGIRNVHQAVTCLDLRHGDRIGHALALGLDPERMRDRARHLVLPAWELLWNLCWERQIRSGVSAPDPHRLAVLEEAYRALREALGRDAGGLPGSLSGAAVQLESAVSTVLLSSEQWEQAEGYPLFRRELETTLRPPERLSNPGAIRELQEIVLDEVAKRGVGIEMCPTSNVLIADLRDYCEHPIFRLAPPEEPPYLRRIWATVSSDDPGLFGTSLRRELLVLEEAAIARGASQAVARRWIGSLVADSRLLRACHRDKP